MLYLELFCSVDSICKKTFHVSWLTFFRIVIFVLNYVHRSGE